MILKAYDKTGKQHIGKEIKTVFITGNDGQPLALIKESILGELINYSILSAGDDGFEKAIKAMGIDQEVIKL